MPLVESVINDLVFAAIAVVFLWAFPERLERRTLLRLLHRLRSLAHVIDMHQLSKDPEQVSPAYTPTARASRHGLDAEQLHHYLDYCSEMLSLTAKTAALCAEHSTDAVVLETISTIETLTTDLSNKIWQKISLCPAHDDVNRRRCPRRGHPLEMIGNVTHPPLTIPALLERSALEFGDHTYLISPTERLTYQEAERRSAVVARWLLREGVGKGTRVGLFFANGVDWAVWWLAASRIGRWRCR